MNLKAEDLRAALASAKQCLQAGGFDFLISGGLASILYGEPRFTHDIDVVLILPPNVARVQAFCDAMRREFDLDDQSALQASRQQSMFDAIHRTTMVKVDFHIGEAVLGEMGRAIQREVMPGLTLPVVSHQDAILSKLLWIKQGSHKSRKDVIGMLIRFPREQVTALKKFAWELDVHLLLDELLAEAERLRPS